MAAIPEDLYEHTSLATAQRRKLLNIRISNGMIIEGDDNTTMQVANKRKVLYSYT